MPSMIEKWEETTLPDRHKDMLLRAWTKYVAGGVKRTTAFDCVRLYEGKLGRQRRRSSRPEASSMTLA